MGDANAGFLGGGPSAALAGATIVIALMGAAAWTILSSSRLRGASLFHRLFIVVAVVSGLFSGVASAIGFSLITSQETDDFFRNALLPPAFGGFVFFLAVAIWVGGAEFARHRDWLRRLGNGFFGAAAAFMERAVKLLIVIPVLALILFFVSTWTTAVGIGGVDAVRHTYNSELARLQAECAGITAHRLKDYLFLEDLRLSIADVSRAARNERTRGTQSGAAGAGAVAAYFDGVAEWLRQLEASVVAIIEGEDPTGVSPYQPGVCAEKTDALKRMLSRNAHVNYDQWAREFETAFDDFVEILNRWRRDRRVETLLDQQLDNFGRANPKPAAEARLSRAQAAAIDRYAAEVESALASLVRRQKLAKPPPPLPSAASLSPERGLAIFASWFAREGADAPVEEARVSRTQSVVYEEEAVAPLSTITPRDAVLKNANIFSDVWALAIAWDYAAYVLMLAYLFFPSAERAPGFKD